MTTTDRQCIKKLCQYLWDIHAEQDIPDALKQRALNLIQRLHFDIALTEHQAEVLNQYQMEQAFAKQAKRLQEAREAMRGPLIDLTTIADQVSVPPPSYVAELAMFASVEAKDSAASAQPSNVVLPVEQAKKPLADDVSLSEMSTRILFLRAPSVAQERPERKQDATQVKRVALGN